MTTDVKQRISPGVQGRMTAAERLVRVSDEGAYAGLIGRAGGESAAVERVVTGFVAGVTRWHRWLDWTLARAYSGDFTALEPRLREMLRIGAYDLLVAETAPHAAVSEAVDASRRLIRPGAARLVNAVLRRIGRERPGIADVDLEDQVQRLAIRWSHPDWMVARWLARFGAEDAQALLVWNNRVPEHAVRITGDPEQRAQTVADVRQSGVSVSEAQWLDDYVVLSRLQPLVRKGMLDAGRVAVQDESAGLVVRLLDPQPGETIVDACAAPGGKTRYIAERLAGRGQVHAVDRSAARVGLMPEGFNTISVHTADFNDWAGTAPPADAVLLDAPCTGLGVLSRRADLRWHRDEASLDELALLQDRLLDAAARAVKPGGRLVYATCTNEPEENADRVEAFLARHADFSIESASGLLPDALVTAQGYYEAIPFRHQIDGAFGARLRRRA